MKYDRERSYVRANRRVRLYFYLHRMPGEMLAFVAKNISAGGLFAVHDAPIPVGTAVVIDMYLEEGFINELVGGNVLRCDEIKAGIWGVAIEFTDISETTRAALMRFVEASLEQEPLPDIERYLLPNYLEELRRLDEEKQRELLLPENY